MTTRDRITYEQGHLVRKREYTNRDRVLSENQELQKADTVRASDGLRPFARFPEHELERLVEKGKTDKNAPSYYADLLCPDGEIATRAKKKLLASSDGRQYRVGTTNRKSFFIRNNPLARDK